MGSYNIVCVVFLMCTITHNVALSYFQRQSIKIQFTPPIQYVKIAAYSQWWNKSNVKVKKYVYNVSLEIFKSHVFSKI